jgi:hypothetical protein
LALRVHGNTAFRVAGFVFAVTNGTLWERDYHRLPVSSMQSPTRGRGEIRSVQGHDKLASPERALISVASPWARGGHIPISKSKSGLTVSLVAAARHGSIFPILKERASALSQ